MSTRLAAQTQKAAGIPNGMRTATITAVSSSGVTINVSGGNISSGVGVLTAYTPIVGDVVNVFRQDSSWLILGRAVASPYGQWVKMADLGYQNGFTDRGGGFPVGQFRTMGNEVQVLGQLSIGSAPANGTYIVDGLPVPGGEIPLCVGTLGAQLAAVHVTGDGRLRLFTTTGAFTTGGFLQFSGTYPLDCLTA